MILESWSIALITCSVVTNSFGLIGTVTALRLLRYWDIGSDSERQIRLEEQIWLTATLVQFGLVVQIISAGIFIYAADYFATVLKGAMCAAGSLTANPYGLPALGFKLATIFVGSLWIMLHRLDISFEDFPYTRIKCFWLLVLMPLLVGDALMVVLYLANLEPEIITSCCGVIFGDVESGGYSLFDYPSGLVGVLSLTAIAALILIGSLYRLLSNSSSSRKPLLEALLALVWIGFYVVSLAVITVQVSPYVYGLPHHRCPFDLLHYPYLVVGLPLYLFLHGGVLTGLGGAMAGVVSFFKGGRGRVEPFIRRMLIVSLLLLVLFLLTAGWRPMTYIVFGGQ